MKAPERIAVVLGGSGAIGKTVAQHLASSCGETILVARDFEKLKRTKQEITHGKISLISCDLMNETSFDMLREQLVGVEPSIVIHAFGSNIVEHENILPTGGWKECMDMYFFRPLVLDQLLIPLMCDRGYGRVIHLSSTAVLSGDSFGPYIAAKSALNQYIRSFKKNKISGDVSVSGIMPRAVEGEGNRWHKMKEIDFDRYLDVRNKQPNQAFLTPVKLAKFCCELIEAISSEIHGEVYCLKD